MKFEFGRLRWGCIAGLGIGILFSGCGRSDKNGAPADDGVDSVVITEHEVRQNNHAVGLMGQYSYVTALEIFRDLADGQPEWLDVHVNLAIATLNRQNDGDEQLAMDILAGVIERQKDHLAARYVLALLQYRNGYTDLARGHLEYVVEHDPEDGYAWYFLGQCLEQVDAQRALQAYQVARDLEPYLRSAYFRAAAVLRMIDEDDEADRKLDIFQELDGNPRARTARFVYSEMGHKANAIAVGVDAPVLRPLPEGPVLGDSRPLLAHDAGVSWNAESREGAISVADISGNGRLDVFIADAIRSDDDANAVIMQQSDGSFVLDRDHVLSKVTDVRAALWGDVDNDGLIDVYLCRRGTNQLLRQTESGWENVTFASGVGGGNFDTVDGVLADLDHDGDLDIFNVNADGPDELFMNNLDGTFRPIAAEFGLAGDERPSRRVLVADLDGSRDLDILVIKDAPPHTVYVNDRLWNWGRSDGYSDLEATSIASAVALDVEVEGRPAVFTMNNGGEITRWQFAAGAFQPVQQSRVGRSSSSFGLLDLTGTGVPAVVLPEADGSFRSLPVDALPDREATHAPISVAWSPVLLDVARGWSIVRRDPGEAPVVYGPGAGRHSFTAMNFVGRDDPGNSMRTNASGIGTRAFARRGSEWLPVTTIRPTGFPSQSLQPWPVGLGGYEALDFVLIDWPDGIFQTEVRGVSASPGSPPRSFASGEVEHIAETQRQVSSCPVIFAWDGDTYVFVSDLLGVGGMGYLLAPGAYAEPRPWEHFMLPQGLPVPRDGRLVIKLVEPMEEATYMDHVAMVAYDLPPGWSMVLDERMGTGEPSPTGQPFFYREERRPVSAIVDGRDVLHEVLYNDLRAVPPGELDHRFMGRLAEPLVLELEFAHPIDDVHGRPVLMIDGWVEYAYSQTMFAAWQAGAEYESLSVEARTAGGEWVMVLERFGYPAGMPRRMSVPLPMLPAGTTGLRLTTNQEVYLDRVSVVFAEDLDEVIRHSCPLVSAHLSIVGFPRRTDGPQRQPHYDYDDRTPFWDVRYQRGWYTREGAVTPLLERRDDAVAIFGPGEELHLEFLAPDVQPPEEWTRVYVLEAFGWCKDMDLFTRDGETIEPLPMVGSDSEHRRRLHREFNTRFESGRSHR